MTKKFVFLNIHFFIESTMFATIFINFFLLNHYRDIAY